MVTAGIAVRTNHGAKPAIHPLARQCGERRSEYVRQLSYFGRCEQAVDYLSTLAHPSCATRLVRLGDMGQRPKQLTIICQFCIVLGRLRP